jgi:hypothetical protein
MEVLIKIHSDNVSFIAITYNDDHLYYVKEFCYHNLINYVDDENDDEDGTGVYCKKRNDRYVVYQITLSNNEYYTRILYELRYITRDTLSQFHKIF